MPGAYARPDQPIPLRQDPAALKKAAIRSLVRACIGIALRTSSQTQHGRAVEELLKNDRDAELLTKAASSPITLASTPGLQGIALAFVDALVPVSASAALIARSLQLQWDHNAEIRVPGLSLPHATFVGEGQPVSVMKGTSSIDAVLTPYKLMVLCHFTNELLQSSNAEALVRSVLLSNVGPSLDAAMFSAAAGVAGASPPGLLHGLTPLAATAGGDLSAMGTDIANLADALAPVSGNGQIVLIAAVKQATVLNMMSFGDAPYPIFSSAALAAGTVIAVASQALATAVSAPAIDASPDAIIHEETSPGPISIGGVIAAPVRSFYQTDSVGIRFRLPVSWALRGPGVAYITGTSW
jgi:hypothetical protein